VGKAVVILGSTGSIGTRALDVIRALGMDYPVVGLAAGGNWRKLAEQALEFRPKRVVLADERHLADLREALSGSGIAVAGGAAAVEELAAQPEADFVLCAIVGSISIRPALAAVRAGKQLGLASKEALVVTGALILEEAAKSGARIIPVDSEHSAIFQAVLAGKADEVAAITLTASGGPFLHWPLEKMRAATVRDALDHPKWSMGRKITIDSATMMNKALEIIEAHYLFGMPAESIRVAIHPEAIVHSLVEFSDGVFIAQLSQPDMAMPIQYALTWPDRRPCIGPKLDLTACGPLTFLEPDRQRFPALELAYAAARAGGSAPAVINAANERAVGRFLNEEIPFHRIVEATQTVLASHRPISRPSLDALLEADRWARDEVDRCLAAH